MTEQTFVVELAGRRWALPHLPFRIIKAIQPALFQALFGRRRSSVDDAAERSADRQPRRRRLARDRAASIPRSGSMSFSTCRFRSPTSSALFPRLRRRRAFARRRRRRRRRPRWENRFRRPDRRSRRGDGLDMGSGARRPDRPALPRAARGVAAPSARALVARRRAALQRAAAGVAATSAFGRRAADRAARRRATGHASLEEMSDANVAVNFTASTSDFESGIAAAREALASLAAPIADLNGKYAALGAALAESHTRALQAMRSGDDAAYADSLRAAQEAISGQIRAEQDGLKEKLDGLCRRRAQPPPDRKRRSCRPRARRSSNPTHWSSICSGASASSPRARLPQRQRVDDQIAQLERNEQRQLAQLTPRGARRTGAELSAVRRHVSPARSTASSADCCLERSPGATRFARRSRDLVIDFLEASDRTVVQWIAGEAAKTAATASGTASRTAAQQAGAAASLASQGAAMIRSILGSAAEAFAGVFGFLAPLMGPFAAGPAAAAQATVASAAGAVASADIGMWSVPADMLTLVHHNELIMPASEAGAFRDLLGGAASGGERAAANVSIAPTTHFHVNAIDAGPCRNGCAPTPARCCARSTRRCATARISACGASPARDDRRCLTSFRGRVT